MNLKPKIGRYFAYYDAIILIWIDIGGMIIMIELKEFADFVKIYGWAIPVTWGIIHIIKNSRITIEYPKSNDKDKK